MMTVDSDVVSTASEIPNKSTSAEIPITEPHAATAEFVATSNLSASELQKPTLSDVKDSHISPEIQSVKSTDEKCNDDTLATVDSNYNGVCNGCSKITNDTLADRIVSPVARADNDNSARASVPDGCSPSQDSVVVNCKDAEAADLFVSQVADAMSHVQWSEDGNVQCPSSLHPPSQNEGRHDVVRRLTQADVPLNEVNRDKTRMNVAAARLETTERGEADDLKCQRLEDGVMKVESIVTKVVEGVECHTRHNDADIDIGKKGVVHHTDTNLSDEASTKRNDDKLFSASENVIEGVNGAQISAVDEYRGISYVVYESERQMPDIMRLITRDLSEPYSIYTYRYFIHNWPHLCFLAMDDSKCVGAIVSKLDLHKKVARRGYIAMLAVDQEYRRRSIGSQLVKRAIRGMVTSGCDEVVLETEISNKAALHLYENLGFVRDKRLFRYYLNGVDALRLKLWLR